MTKIDKLVTAHEGVELPAANKILIESKRAKLPIVTVDGCLVALVARKDL
eukprot:CAMPEP_0195074570 /NCGR_PEP_ID=MMETSP0448-20130528/17657_1 /TAXON_ID=66468 /ORGANISM="Heterocapsa triquestra, Strain CCMP 448" /LENGTH=49 /DNA_ID= /DNA_START= /DNA_END= /DNA_ORIENTATION=